MIATPTNSLVDTYVKKFSNDERYYLADLAISNLFEKFPENEILEDVLLKISVINDLYSTNIFATFKMAAHIKGLGISEKLHQGNSDLVAKIATGHGICSSKSNREINFYSFATKYCNWHNKENYPIYDRFVEKILIAYRDQDKFAQFGREDLKQYDRFKAIIIGFKDHYNLTQHNLKEIDKFLWIYGKELFPNEN